MDADKTVVCARYNYFSAYLCFQKTKNGKINTMHDRVLTKTEMK